jgi:hypothetical protein
MPRPCARFVARAFAAGLILNWTLNDDTWRGPWC